MTDATSGNNDIPLKRCSKCGEEHPATADFFARHSKNWLRSYCKACYHEIQRERAKRPEALEQSRRAYQRNPERQERKKAYCKVYNQRPEARERRIQRDNTAEARQRKSASQKAYMQRPGVKEHKRAYNREYARRPYARERRRAYLQQYNRRPDAQEKKRVWHHNYQQAHGHSYYFGSRDYLREYYKRPGVHERMLHKSAHRRARKLQAKGSYTAEQIQQLLRRQKYRCYYAACGYAKFEKRDGKYIYHIEHTFPLSRASGGDDPINDISYLVLSCPSCNRSKNAKFPWEWPEGGRLL